MAVLLLGWSASDVDDEVRRHREYVHTKQLGGVARRVPEDA